VAGAGCNVPVTVRDDTWYLHVHQLVDDRIIVSNGKTPRQAHWMRSGAPVDFVRCEDDYVYDSPSGMPSTDGAVIVVNFYAERHMPATKPVNFVVPTPQQVA